MIIALLYKLTSYDWILVTLPLLVAINSASASMWTIFLSIMLDVAKLLFPSPYVWAY